MKGKLFIILLLVGITNICYGQIPADVNRQTKTPLTGTYAGSQSVRDFNLTAIKNLRIPLGSSFSIAGAKDSLGYLMFNTSIMKMGIYRGSNTWDTLSTTASTNLLNYYTKAQSDARYASGFTQLPNGKNVVDFTIDGANARITTSNNYSITGTPQKLAIFFHFYGGNYTSMPSSKLRDSLLNNGYSITSISVGDDSWGNEMAIQLYQKLYNYCIKKFNVDNQPIAVGASMGSLAALNVINRNLIPFRAFINTIGVVNLGEYYGRQIGQPAGTNIQFAYGFSTPADSTKAFYGFDPYKRLHKDFGDTTYKVSAPVYSVSGALDTSAPVVFTQRMHNGLVQANSNSVLEIIPSIGHDTGIVTSAVSHRIILWLKSNPLTNYALADTAKKLKTTNGLWMVDKTSTPGFNFIDFLQRNNTRRGLFGFVDPSVIGSNGMVWQNDNGNIGIFADSLTHEVSMGTLNSSTGHITKNFILNKAALTVSLPININGNLGIVGNTTAIGNSIHVLGSNVEIRFTGVGASSGFLGWYDAGGSEQNAKFNGYDYQFNIGGVLKAAITHDGSIEVSNNNGNANAAVRNVDLSTSLALKANLSGGNNFTGNQYFANGIVSDADIVLENPSTLANLRLVRTNITGTKTVKFQNKNYTVADSVDLVLKANLAGGNTFSGANVFTDITAPLLGYTKTLTASGTGVATTISIAHGLSGVTTSSAVVASANTSAAGGYNYVDVDATNVNFYYTVAPVLGTNNLKFSITIK